MTNQLSNAESLILLQFWVEQLETIRDRLTTEAVWIRWYVQQGQTHFNSWRNYRGQLEWTSEGVEASSILSYLRSLPIIKRKLAVEITEFVRLVSRSDVDIMQQYLMDLQLHVLFVLPPSLELFDLWMCDTNRLEAARNGTFTLNGTLHDMQWYLLR